jgi:hypothetical protein
VNPHIRVDNRITSFIIVPNNILTIGHMTKYDIAMQGKSTTKQRIPSSVDDPRHTYYPTGKWLGDIPSSHQCHHNHRHLPCSPLHSLTKLIARDKAMSTFWIVLANHLKRRSLICSMAVARKGYTLVCFLWKHTFSCRYVTRVNSTNVLDEGLRIGEIGRRMNSKVKSVKQGVYQK